MIEKQALAEFQAAIKPMLIERLKRLAKLLSLNAPEIILDHAYDLVNQSMIAYLGEYALRRQVDRMQREYGVKTGHCGICLKRLEPDSDVVCVTCEAECQAMEDEADAADLLDGDD